MHFTAQLTLISIFVLGALSRSVPSNVRAFYNALKQNGTCANPLASNFWSCNEGSDIFSYCGDHYEEKGIIYIQGTHGAFPNMDVNCNGEQGGPADDGRCADGSAQHPHHETDFNDIVESYGKGIRDLNPYVHPYVVFGNLGGDDWSMFFPDQYGVLPLSVMAVVCGDKLIYGIWGEGNGMEGLHPFVGEASVSLATACYGKNMTGHHSHNGQDVLYIAFTGLEALPGADGAKWEAKNYDEFEKSIEEIGDRLIAKL
ncbi:chitosanase [Cercophora newfieldiana]|uniref:Endo-chitosanase n=1 Tax=Cercophora newfieldiana TaxID=92897 RepID=A0AA39YB17_9PEZI|nr:chitosanase [Cercophora newfieldiana]